MRHVKRQLAKWLQQHGHSTRQEVHLPQLDTTDDDGTTTQAILDIVSTHENNTHYIDVSITNPMTTSTATNDATPTNTNAAKRREQDKRRRYPTPHLIPFVLETYGRMGDD